MSKGTKTVGTARKGRASKGWGAKKKLAGDLIWVLPEADPEIKMGVSNMFGR